MLKFSAQLIKLMTMLMMVLSLDVMAGFPTPTDPFEIPQGAYQAEFVRDLGHVAQIRFAGDYDRNLQDGSFNRAARATVAQEFYKNHSDDYDILLVFTEFPVETGDAVAFHYGVKNSIKGIGKSQYDLSNMFGSDGKLGSYIDFAELDRWDFNPGSEGNEYLLTVAMHEIMHRWVAGVQVMENGQPSDTLNGHQGVHWSALLDTDASVMFGADWTKTASNTYLASNEVKRFSALDLYMAGLYGPAEVGTIRVIDSPDIERDAIWVLGTSVKGTEKYFTVADIVAAEGERIPSFKTSQKRFKTGIVFLTSDFTLPSSKVISQLNQFGEEVAVRFAHLTGGRGFIHVANTPQTEAEEFEEDKTELRDDINNDLALFWLNAQQNAGYWEDTSYTKIRDSVTANRVLSLLDENYQAEAFQQWLKIIAMVGNNDDRAFLAASGDDEASTLLSVTRNSDGGWGLRKTFSSTVFDTATVLNQVPQFSNGLALSFILGHQNSDGGWPRGSSGISDFKTTALTFSVLSALSLESEAGDLDSVLAQTANWLFTYLEGNAGADLSSSDLATVLISASRIKSDVTHLSSLVNQSLSESQQDNGSWGSSSYSTALVLEALASAELANLVISGNNLAVHNITAGAPVSLETLIVNDGAVDAGEFTVGLYLNEISPSQLLSQQTISSLASGSRRILDWHWESGTQQGNQRLIVSVDDGRLISEKTKTDNVYFRDISVLVPSTDANLAVFSADINVTPGEFDAFSEQLDVTAVVRNLSLTDVGLASISLWVGNGIPEQELGQQQISVAAGNHKTVTFSASTEFYNSLFIRVESPEDSSVSDNQARINLKQKDALDFVLDEIVLLTQPPFDFGQDLEFDVLVSDQGTTASPTSDLSLIIQKNGSTIDVIKKSINLSSGEQSNNRFVWRPKSSGDYTLIASVDDANLIAEVDETNNQSLLPITVSLSDKANLNVSFRDIQIPEKMSQGTTAKFIVTVRNTGSGTSEATTLQLFHGNPDIDGISVAEVPIVSLASEESTDIEVFWDDIKAKGRQLVFVRLDPNNFLDEANEGDNDAFVEVDIEAMADLFISDTLINLSPSVATTGTLVSAMITIANTGGQEIHDSEFEVFVDGDSIGRFPIVSLPAYSNILETINIDTSTLIKSTSIVVVLDPDDSLAEQSESNNEASALLVIGSSDLYISEPYISPNGDGILESAELFADFNVEIGQSLVVRNVEGSDIATFAPDVSFPITWYGSVNGQRLGDGEYSVNIISSDGNVVESEKIIIDTNSSSVLEVMNDDFKLQYFYQDIFGSLAWLRTYSNDERIVFYVLPNADDQKLIPGIYTADFTGSDIQLVTLENNIKFDRSSYYNGTPYYDFMSLSSDNFSLIIAPNSYGGEPYVRIDLQTSSYEELPFVKTDYQSEYYYEYENVLYLVKYKNSGRSGSESTIKLSSVNKSTGELALIDEYSYFGSRAYESVVGKKIDKDVLISQYGFISFKNLEISAPIIYDSGFEVSLENYQVKITALETNEEKLFSLPQQSNKEQLGSEDVFGLDIDTVRLTSVEFNKNKTKLMLYFTNGYVWMPDYDPFSNSPVDSSFNPILGYAEYMAKLNVNVATEVTPPIPGYRIELDLGTGKYTFKSYFSEFDSIQPGAGDAEDEGYQYHYIAGAEKFYDSNTASSTFSRYELNGYPIAFEGPERGGVYLSDNEYLDQSLYLDLVGEPEELNGRGTNVGFLSYAIDAGTDSVPFVSDFKYTTLEVLANGSLLFFDAIHKNDTDKVSYVNAKPNVPNVLLVNTQNLSAYLSFTYEGDNQGVGLRVLATDKNFSSFKVDYRLKGDSSWNSIVPINENQRYSDFVTTWVPPSEGNYTVRLMVEDKAGNKKEFRKNLIWSYGANISEIALSDNVFSPNLDGVSDVLGISYRILRPSNISFLVHSENGSQVLERTISANDIGNIGTEFWDGRNESGTRVPDGLYKIYIDGYLYYIVVDTVPPTIENCTYHGRICAKSNDDNIITEQYYEVLKGSEWQKIDSENELSFNSIAVFDAVSYRYVAIDEAGNRQVSEPLENVLNKTIHLVDVYQDTSGLTLTRADTDKNGVRYVYSDIVGETILEYRYSNAATVLKLGYLNVDGEMIKTGITVPAVFDNQRFTINTKSLKSIFDQLGIVKSKLFYYLVDDNDEVNSEYFNYTSGAIFELDLNYNGIVSFEIIDTSIVNLETDSSSYSVKLSSTNPDSRYATPVIIFRAEKEIDGFSYKQRLLDLVLESCSSYTIDIIFDDGRTLSDGFKSSCVDVSLLPAPPELSDVVQCNQASEQIFYKMEVYEKQSIGEPRISAKGVSNVSVYTSEADKLDVKRYLYSDGYSEYKKFSIDKTQFSVGQNWYLFFEITFDDGHVEEFAKGKISFDNYVPVITVNSPLSGQKICAKSDPENYGDLSWVEIQGAIVDYGAVDKAYQASSISDYKVVLNMAQEHCNPEASPGEGKSKSDKLCDEVLTLSTELNTEGRHGILRQGILDVIFDLDGNQSISYSAFDAAGNLSCGQLDFTVDSQVHFEFTGLSNKYLNTDAGIDLFGISPNGDGKHDDLRLLLNTLENVYLEVSLGETVVYSASIQTGTSIVTIPGNNINLADGEYKLDVKATDDCGFIYSNRKYNVEIDNRIPDVAIIYPKLDDELFPVTGVKVDLFDKNIESFDLAFKSEDSLVWNSLKAGNKNVYADVIHELNLSGLDGIYQVRLSATDKLENYSERIVELNVTKLGSLLSYYEAGNVYLSPNGDGIQDDLLGSVSVSRSASVEFFLKDISVHTITSLSAGENNWKVPGLSLSDLGDNAYTLKLVASDASDENITESGSLEIILDSTPPVLIVDTDTDADGRFGVIEVITIDANMSEFRYEIINESGNSVQASIKDSFLQMNTPFIINMSGEQYPEGAYLFVYTLSDKAGNKTSDRYDFIYDKTAPVLTVAESLQHSIVINQINDALSLSYSYKETNPVSVLLKLNDEILYSLNEFSSPQVTGDVNLEALSDNIYEMILVITDVSGNEASVPLIVQLDSKAPEIQIEQSAAQESNSEYIRPGLDLIITLKDDSELSGVIVIAGEIEVSSLAAEQVVRWPSDLVDGSYEVKVQAEDAAGNKDQAVRTFIQDSVAPLAVSLVTAENTSGVIKVSWSVSNSSDVNFYRVYRNGELLLESTAIGIDDTLLDDGRYEYRVTAVDFADNESLESMKAVLIIDTHAPEVSIVSPQNNSVAGGVIEFSGNVIAGDLLKVEASIEAEGQVIVLSSSAISGNNIRFGEWDSSLFSGVALFRIVATDESGNETDFSHSITLDNSAPPTPVGLTVTVTNGNTIKAVWQPVQDDQLAGYQVWRSGADISGELLVTEFIETDVADGSYRYAIVSIDVNGNLSAPSDAVAVAIDNRAPDLSIIRPQPNASFEKILNAEAIFTDTDVVKLDLVLRNAALESVAVKALTFAPYSTVFETEELPYGAYEITLTATDAAGNIQVERVSINKSDLTPPEAVTQLTAINQLGNIHLEWIAPQADDLNQYHVVLLNDAGFEIDSLTTADTVGGFSSLTEAGIYTVRITATDTSGNISLPTHSEEIPYYFISAVFPYSPVSDDFSIIEVSSQFVGEAELRSADTVLLAQSFGKTNKVIFEQDLTTVQENLAVHAQYETVHSPRPISYQLLRAEKPVTPDVPELVLKEDNQITIALTSALDTNDVWFMSRNNHLESSLDVFSSMSVSVFNYTSNPNSTPEVLSENNLGTDFWLRGVRVEFPNGGRENGSITFAEVWNGINWMRMPFVTEANADSDNLLFAFPVNADRIRINVHVNSEQYFYVRWTPLGAVIHTPEEQVIVTDTAQDLNGIDATGLSITATVISSIGVIGDASNALSVRAHSDDALAEIVLSAELINEFPVLSWQTTADEYQNFYLQHNQNSQQKITADGSGVYQVTDPVYADGLNHYQVIAVTADGRSKSSQVIDVSLTLKMPAAVTNFAAVVNSVDQSVGLSWSDVQTGVYYDVYRRHLLEVQFSRIHSSNELVFVDADVQANSTYQYYVVAVNKGNKSGILSETLSVSTTSDDAGLPPQILAPISGMSTSAESLSVLIAALPQQQVLIQNNNTQNAGVITSESLGRVTMQTTETRTPIGYSPYLFNRWEFGSAVKDLYSGQSIDWLEGLEGEILYKGNNSAYINQWGDLIRFDDENNKFYITGDIVWFDVATNDSLLAVTDYSHLFIRYGDAFSENVMLNEEFASSFASAHVSVSENGNFVAVYGNNKLSLINVTDRTNPVISDLSTVVDSVENVSDITWLNSDRLAIIGDSIQVINTNGMPVYKIMADVEATLKFPGYYSDYFVAIHYDDAAEKQAIKVYSSVTGRLVYQFSVLSQELSYQADNEFISAYGLLCAPMDFDTSCRLLPGMTEVSIDLSPARNDITAIRNLPDGRELVSEILEVHRNTPEITNAELTVSEIIRSLGRVSDIDITLRHNSGKSVGIEGLTLLISQPDGTVEEIDINDMPETLEPGETFSHQYHWSPDQNGQYSIEIKADLDDDISNDNTVVFDAVIAAVDDPRIGISVVNEKYIDIALNTLAYQGDATMVIRMNSYRGEEQFVIAAESYSAYTDYEYQYAPSDLEVWGYGFELIAELHSNGVVIAEQSLDIQGDLLAENFSEVSLRLNRDEVTTGASATLTYTLEINTPAIFNGSLTITATHQSGTQTMLAQLPLAYLFDGEVVEQVLVISDELLAAGNYQITASLSDNRPQVIDTASVALTVNEAPVRYNGSLSSADTVIGMGADLSLEVNVTGSLSNTPENIAIYLIADDMSGLKLADINSAALPYAATIDLSSLTASLGDKLIRLKVVPENRSEQVLSEIALNIIDIVPPILNVLSPVNNGFINEYSVAEVAANDAHSGIDRVQLSVGSNEPRSLLRADATYNTALSDLVEGQHQLNVSAYDVAGNFTRSGPINVTMDKTRPQLILTGVADGMVYREPVSISITATDLYLETTKLSVNGAISISDTVVISDDGTYRIVAEAMDKAGNRTLESLSFVLDQTAPVITVSGIQDGAIYTAGVSYGITVEDNDVSTLIIRLNDSDVSASGDISDDGMYSLSVTATDSAGNSATVLISFLIDSTAPELPLISVSDGQQFENALIPLTGSGESGSRFRMRLNDVLSEILITDDGFSLDLTLREGLNTVEYWAVDAAGNESGHVVISVSLISLPEFELVGQENPLVRALVWVPWYDSNSDETEEFVRTAMNSYGTEYHISTSESDFKEQLRSQRYTVVVLMHTSHIIGLPSGFSVSLSSELRAMVAQGMGLVTVSNQLSLFDIWEDVYGINGSRSDVKALGFTLNDEILGNYELTLSGIGSRVYVESDAAGLGDFEVKCLTIFHCREISEGQYPGLVDHYYGLGRVMTSSFDLAGAIPSADSKRLLRSMISKVAPKHINGFSYQWRTLEIVSASGTVNNLNVTIRYDESFASVFVNNNIITSGESFILNMKQELMVKTIGTFAAHIELDITYNDEFIRTETLIFESPLSSYEADWQALIAFVDDMDVAWYKVLSHLIMENDLENARATNVSNQIDVDYVRVRLVDALRTTKIEFSDQSEAFALLAGKLLLELESKQVD